MPSVDNRVVRMDFDNKKFENDVKTTTSSLDKLKNSLKFDGATQGLKNVGAAAKGLTFDPISAGIERVRQNVSVASVAIIAAIMNITNRAVNSGIQIGKSLSLDPLMNGFKEYETNMNAIQTVLANTSKQGTTLEQVNDALDKLNAYSDQTIYNFGEMAKNIGTFTAAGVNLDTSVSSIKGIANVAAMSGSNAEQASNAMYQLSQAIANGAVKAQDWISVNNASMGGRVFQESLFETAKAMKTIPGIDISTTFDQWTDAGNKFKDSLQEGWLTSEVLTTTLTAFTGDLNEEQLVALGYTKDQAIEFAKLAKTASDAAVVVKTFSQLKSTVKENIASGWSESFRIVVGDFEEARTLFTVLNKVIGNIVNPITDARNAMLGAWKMFGGRTVLLQGLIYGFQAVASVVRAVSTAFRQVFPKKTLPELLQLTKKFKDFTQSLKPNEETLSNIRSIARGVFSVFAIAISIVSALGKVVWGLAKAIGGSSVVLPLLAKLGDYLYALRYKLDEGLPKFISTVAEMLNALVAAPIQYGLAFIGNMFGRIGTRTKQAGAGVSKLGGIFGWLADQIRKIPEVLKSAFSKENFNTSIDLLNVGIFATLVGVLANFFRKILAFDFGAGFIEKLRDIFDQLGKTLGAFQLKLKADAIRSIAISIGILVGSLFLLSLIDSGKLLKALLAMAVTFLMMGGMMLALYGLSQSMDSTMSNSIIKMAVAILVIGLAMGVFAFALKRFSGMSWEELLKGLVGLGGAFAAIGIAIKSLPEDTDMLKAGGGIWLISKAAKNLANAVEAFGNMEWKALIQGMLALYVVIQMLVEVIKSLPEKEMLNAGIGILLISFAIHVITSAVSRLGNMDIATLVQGLAAFGVIMAALAFTLQTFPKNMDKVGLGVLAISAGLLVMAMAIGYLGTMKMETMLQGLLGLIVLLYSLAIVVQVLDKSIAGVQSIVTLAGALIIMAIAIKLLGSMSLGEIVIAIIGLAAAIGVIAAASLLSAPAIPVITGLAGAFALFGVAILAIGAGAILLAKAMDMVRQSGTAGLSSIGGAIGVVISKIGEFVSALYEAFTGMVKKFFSQLPDLLRRLLQIITNILPAILTFVVTVITRILEAIRTNLPRLVTAVIEIIATFINTIAANLGIIIAAGTNLIVAWIRGMDNASQFVIDAVTDLIVNFINGVRNSASRIIEAGRSLIVTVIEGMDDAITDPNDGIVPAIRNMIISFINAVADSYGDIIDAGVEAVAKFLEGLGNNAWEIVDAAGKFILSVLNALEAGINKYAPEIRNAAIRIGLAIIDGMTFGLGTKALKFMGLIDDVGAQAIDAARESVDAHSPSRAFMEIGKDMMDGLTIGIARNSSVVDATRRVGSEAVTALNNSLSLLSSSLENVNEFNPTITPVLDLSNVQNGSKFIGSMLGSSSIGANVSFGKASAISGMQNQNAKNSAVEISPRVNEIKFEQTINSPVALTTSEIYRNTKTQISMAKEELRLV